MDFAFKHFIPQAPLTRYIVFDNGYWTNELLSYPLERRGWALQEKVLARMVLHLSRNQLIWECAELTTSEAYPRGFLSLWRQWVKTNRKFLQLNWHASVLTDSTSHINGRLTNEWSDIVENYTQYQLTRPEDKLLAISGLAKRTMAIVQDEYIIEYGGDVCIMNFCSMSWIANSRTNNPRRTPLTTALRASHGLCRWMHTSSIARRHGCPFLY